MNLHIKAICELTKHVYTVSDMKRTHSETQMFTKKTGGKKSNVMFVEQPASRKRKRSNAQLATEKKFLDNSLANQALQAATTMASAEIDPATTLCLTAPAQNDTASGRDGKQIIGKYLVIKGKIFCPTQELEAAPPATTEVYVAAVWDKQTNNAQLNSEDVFLNVPADSAVNCCPLRNLNFGKRFKILKEERFVFDNTALSHFAVDSFSHSGRGAYLDWYIPLRDMVINFNSVNTGVIGNVMDNSVHLIAYTNATTMAPSITYQSRFRFIG